MKKIRYKLVACFLVLTLCFCNVFYLINSEAATVSKVSNLYMYSSTTKSITLKWKKPSYATGYMVYRSNSSSRGFSTIKNITKSSTTTYTNSSLSSGKTYYYKVRAYRKIGKKTYYGSYSNVVKASTKKSASQINKEAMSAYKKFLTNTSYVHPENYEEPAKTEKFALLDINKDGVKELLITDRKAYNNGSQDNGYQYAYVYTYKSSKVKYCGYAHGSSFTSLYIDGKGRLGFNWGGGGHSQCMYYNLNSSKDRLRMTIFTKHFDLVESFDKQVCDYNYKNGSKVVKISESTFEYEQGVASKAKLLKVYSNNSSNRSKYLK